MTTPTAEVALENIAISVYPNPASRFLRVDLPADLPTVSSIKMVNTTGQIVYEQQDISVRYLEIDLRDLTGTFDLIFEVDRVLVGRRVMVF